jgi:hypothetical protein
MSAKFQVVGLVTLLVLGFGCAHAGDHDDAGMVLETRAPSHPPVAKIVVGSGETEIGVTGALYTSDWSTRLAAATRAPRVPVPWPRPSLVDLTREPRIALETTATPDHVTMSTFASVATATGTPSAGPIASFECGRFTEPRCKVATSSTGIRISGLSRGLLSGRYVTVFCTWHVPRTDQHLGADGSDDVSASWIFHIGDRRQRQRSRP